jgi:hypothetical protein
MVYPAFSAETQKNAEIRRAFILNLSPNRHVTLTYARSSIRLFVMIFITFVEHFRNLQTRMNVA